MSDLDCYATVPTEETGCAELWHRWQDVGGIELSRDLGEVRYEACCVCGLFRVSTDSDGRHVGYERKIE